MDKIDSIIECFVNLDFECASVSEMLGNVYA